MNVAGFGAGPTVSVICHTYNHAPYIRQTLESLLVQETDFPVEIIVHDDASTDGTAEIIREVSAENPESLIQILQSENQFSQGRRPSQFTFPRAQGEFIALCEGDDYWVSSDKLQRQVDALRQFPNLNLCVHPAMRLSMHTGKQVRAFDYGTGVRIIPSEIIIARHNQFAPTASMVMRARAAKKLPEWFFNELGLPVGDFFIEAILGRSGVLYLPDVMSVYRRDVLNSYTNRFRSSSGQDLEDSLTRMLYFTEKLRGMEGIREEILDQRLSYVRLNYALQFLAAGDRDRFERTSRQINLRDHRVLLAALAMIRYSRLAFAVARKAFVKLRRLKR